MSLRSILLGLLSVAVLCSITYLNNYVLQQTPLIGTHFPVAVFGSLVLFLLLGNPLLRLIRQRLALTGREIAVILTLTLAGCCVPGAGLMFYFSNTLALPFHHAQINPSWQQYQLLERMPPAMFPEITEENRSTVLGGFVQSLRTGSAPISVSQVPWHAWVRPLLFWMPFIFLLWICLLGLTLVVHPQWSQREQLPYPIAAFANALLPGKQAVSEVFRNKLFWIGLLPVVIIHLNNYLCQWFPDLLMKINLTLNLFPWEQDFLYPIIRASGFSSWVLLLPTIIFTVIAVAYFLPTDVSLSLGIGPLVWYLIAGSLTLYGIEIRSGSPSSHESISCGSYIGMFLVICYIGRNYYRTVFRRAVGLRANDEAPHESVWGARIFLVCLAGMLFYTIVIAGLDWLLALVLISTILLIYLVMSRIIAETGMYYQSPAFGPLTVMLGMFGIAAVGPHMFLLASLLSSLLLVGTHESLMPFLINGFRVLDYQKVNISKVARAVVLALLVGVAVSFPVTLYLQYDRGVTTTNFNMNSRVTNPFNGAVRASERLLAQGKLAQSDALSGLQRIPQMSLQPQQTIAFAIGLGLMLLFTFARLRLPRWPLHPVMFLIWTTWPITWFCTSFFIGWILKSWVVRFGGSRLYQNLKPLMVGFIAGEMLIGVLIAIFAAAYYFVTGEPPKPFSVMPGG